LEEIPQVLAQVGMQGRDVHGSVGFDSKTQANAHAYFLLTGVF
jgi:hypothetical protein